MPAAGSVRSALSTTAIRHGTAPAHTPAARANRTGKIDPGYLDLVKACRCVRLGHKSTRCWGLFPLLCPIRKAPSSMVGEVFLCRSSMRWAFANGCAEVPGMRKGNRQERRSLVASLCSSHGRWHSTSSAARLKKGPAGPVTTCNPTVNHMSDVHVRERTCVNPSCSKRPIGCVEEFRGT